MWWVIYQIAACCLVACCNVIFRYYGLNIKSWLVCIGIAPFAQFCFGKSFALAPNILSPWILGNLILAIAGLLFSIFLFDGVLAFRHYLGLILAMIAGYLLVS